MPIWPWPDTGAVISPSTNIEWNYVWTIPPSRWTKLGYWTFYIPDLTPEEKAAIGSFSIAKTDAAYVGGAARIHSTSNGEFSRSGGGEEAQAEDLWSLDDAPGIIDYLLLSSSGKTAMAETVTVSFGNIQSSAPWTEEDFNARKKIIVKKEAVTGSPTNVPVKVDYTRIDNELYWVLANHSAGSALTVTTAEGVEIPCEAGIRSIGANETVRLFFLAPMLSSEEDTVFYIYYSSEENVPRTFEAGAIWLPGREGVWHDGFEVIWNGMKRG